ncbi:MAG: SRPBCC family protein [Pontiella sp.]
MYKLTKEIFVDTSMEHAWNFISNPANLNKITPDHMDFEIISELPDVIAEGMLLEYRMKIPLLGTQPWLSELKHIVSGHSFVDEQRVGPYKLWIHYHGIVPTESGVKFVDRVIYEVPFGVFGKLAHALFIRKTLERVFAFREISLQSLLPRTEKTKPND